MLYTLVLALLNTMNAHLYGSESFTKPQCV